MPLFFQNQYLIGSSLLPSMVLNCHIHPSRDCRSAAFCVGGNVSALVRLAALIALSLYRPARISLSDSTSCSCVFLYTIKKINLPAVATICFDIPGLVNMSTAAQYSSLLSLTLQNLLLPLPKSRELVSQSDMACRGNKCLVNG